MTSCSLFDIDSSIDCTQEPGSKIIQLPTDCTQTGQTTFDVGTCGENTCSSNKLNQDSEELLLCIDPKNFCCQAVETEVITISCQGYSLPITRALSCGCGECKKKSIQILGRVVLAESLIGVPLVSIFYRNMEIGKTNVYGNFDIDIENEARQVSLTFKDMRFKRVLDATIVVQIKTGFVEFVNVKMKSTPDPIKTDSSLETSLSFSGTESNAVGQLVLERNSYYDSDGFPYTGDVSVFLNDIDMRNITDIQFSPGDFTAVDDNGYLVEFESFSIFSVGFNDPTGNFLSVAGPTRVIINQDKIPPCIFDENGACDTKLWELNANTGSWEQAGSLYIPVKRKRKRQNESLIGMIEINRFSWFSVGRFSTSQRCFSKIIAYVSNSLKPDQVLENPYEASSITRDSTKAFLRKRTIKTYNEYGSIGVCVPHGCDDIPGSNPISSRKVTVYLFVRYGKGFLTPADPNIGNKFFSLSLIDTSEIDYQPDNTELRMKPLTIHATPNGPLYDDETCSDADIDDKHVQFFSESEIHCHTAHSTVNITSRLPITFYPQEVQQSYCFVGLHILTIPNTAHRIVATSELDKASSSQMLTGDIYFGRREIRVQANSDGIIKACMEFKCSGLAYDQTSNLGVAYTKVTIDVKDVSGVCNVTAYPQYLDTSCSAAEQETPICFLDPELYGSSGFQKKRSNFIPMCENDNDSPQAIGLQDCEQNGAFVSAISIECPLS